MRASLVARFSRSGNNATNGDSWLASGNEYKDSENGTDVVSRSIYLELSLISLKCSFFIGQTCGALVGRWQHRWLPTGGNDITNCRENTTTASFTRYLRSIRPYQFASNDNKSITKLLHRICKYLPALLTVTENYKFMRIK